MEQKVVVKDELDVHDDLGCNVDVKQELSDEVSIVTIQNVNEKINNAYPIKQEMHEAFKTVDISEMKIDQTVVKDEIDIHDDFGWNIDAKQEFNDQVPIVTVQNVSEKINNAHPIKQEKHDDFNIVHIFEECMVAVKTERDSSDNIDTHIINKSKYMKVKCGRQTKSKRLLKYGKRKALTGIMICGFCGNLYTKQVEFHFHCSSNHCVKRKKLLYKTTFSTAKTENELETELQINRYKFNVQCVNEVIIGSICNCSNSSKKYSKCDICTKFSDKKNLNEHITKKPFNCDICSKSFMGRIDLNRHSRTHTGEKPFKCDICFKSFSRNSSLKRHMLCHMCEKSYKCNICSKSFVRKGDLKRHSIIHTEQKPFKCGICLKLFSRKAYFKLHEYTHIRENLDDAMPEKLFKCDICFKSFSSRTGLNRHSLSHTGEKPFNCVICMKSFTFRSVLKKHLRSHTGEKLFKCDLCEKSFVEKGVLKIHLHSHTGEKPYECDICLKSFSQKQHLNVHLRSHTGEKPYQCEICLKTFTQTSNLNKHLLIHTGEKPFKCNICLKSFTQKSGLNSHMPNHTGDKPFKCDLCAISFCRKGDLNKHLRRHPG